MAVTDPVDARLLAALADAGKAAVHELAARVGIDPREAAYRLVSLSGSGLPLLVGVECDPRGLRAATAGAWQGQTPSGQVPVQGLASGPMPGQQPNPVQGAPSGVYPAHGTPSGTYPVPGRAPAQGGPSGPYAVRPQQVPGRPPYPPQLNRTVRPAQQQAAPAPLDPSISTWGPPQTASWTRSDDLAGPSSPPAERKGRIGDRLRTQGLENEQLDIVLLEVQDPADYLFGAAGYRLDAGERAIVVHTEIKNIGTVPFASLPDNYLELLTDEGKTVGKAPVSLTSRPPHRIGVPPGETLGGHTVYILPESTRVVAVRWNRRPESDDFSITWSIDD